MVSWFQLLGGQNGGAGGPANRPQEPFNKNNNRLRPFVTPAQECSHLKKANKYHYIKRMDACVPECEADISFSGRFTYISLPDTFIYQERFNRFFCPTTVNCKAVMRDAFMAQIALWMDANLRLKWFYILVTYTLEGAILVPERKFNFFSPE